MTRRPPAPDPGLLYLTEKDEPDPGLEGERRFSVRDLLALGWVILALGGTVAMAGLSTAYIASQEGIGITHRWCLSIAPDYPQPPSTQPPGNLGGAY